jgi:hypothetical protein
MDAWYSMYAWQDGCKGLLEKIDGRLSSLSTNNFLLGKSLGWITPPPFLLPLSYKNLPEGNMLMFFLLNSQSND